jgi:predicted flap endonuclease-1-like 5' DNA nuclease
MAPDDLPPRGDLAAPDAAPQGPRQTLAMRLAERNRQRELRAERLARLRPPSASAPAAAGSAAAPAGASTPARPESADAAEAALEDFLRALTADCPPPEAPPAEPGALLSFQRPAEAPAQTPGDLDRLPGVGPGLVWALERAGLRCLAHLAPLAPSELAARLGPLGRLIPAERWIATARAAEA